MRRSSSNPEGGSALIEAVVIGSFVFIVVMAAVSATIRVSLTGEELASSARIAAVHSARHSDPAVAESMAAWSGHDASADRVGDSIRVVVVTRVDLPHPDGRANRLLVGRGEMPLAPFRSDRG